MCKLGGRADSFGRAFSLVDGFIAATRGILDRPTHKSGFSAEPYSLGGSLRVIAKTVLKVRAHGEVRGCGYIANVGDHPVAAYGVVALPDRERESGAGGRQRLKPQMSEQTSRSNVPGVWNDERAGPLV
jgi:hypothetical protein